MDEMKFRSLCEQFNGFMRGIQHNRVRAVALIGFLEGSEKGDPGLTYSTDQVIRIIDELIYPEIE